MPEEVVVDGVAEELEEDIEVEAELEASADEKSSKKKNDEPKGMAKLAKLYHGSVKATSIEIYPEEENELYMRALHSLAERGRAACNMFLASFYVKDVGYVPDGESLPKMPFKFGDDDICKNYRRIREITGLPSVAVNSASRWARSTYCRNRREYLLLGHKPLGRSSGFMSFAWNGWNLYKEAGKFRVTVTISIGILREVLDGVIKDQAGKRTYYQKQMKSQLPEDVERRQFFQARIDAINKKLGSLRKDRKELKGEDISPVRIPFKVKLSDRYINQIQALEFAHKVMTDKEVTSINANFIELKKERGSVWLIQIPTVVPKAKVEVVKDRTLYMEINPDTSFLRGRVRGVIEGVDWTFNCECQSVAWIPYKREKLRKALAAKIRMRNRQDNPWKGKGKTRRLRNIKKNTAAFDRRVTNYNHSLSRYIVEMARRWKCDKISIPDLTKLNPEKLALGHWSYYQILIQIQQKAETFGIRFEKLDPEILSEALTKLDAVGG